MQRPYLDRDIKALSDFRASIRECIAEVRNSGRPIVITQHGRPCAVLLDVSVFESLLGTLEGHGQDTSPALPTTFPVPLSDSGWQPLTEQQVPIHEPQNESSPLTPTPADENAQSTDINVEVPPASPKDEVSESDPTVTFEVPVQANEPAIPAATSPMPDKPEPPSTPDEQHVWQQAEPKRRTVRIRRVFKPAVVDARKQSDASGSDLIPCDYSKILIADDEKTIRDVFKMVLSYGLPDCRVDLAVNGAEALSRFGTSHHGIVLMDLKMPAMTGETAFDEIQKLCVQLKWEMPSIVFCTGYDPPHRIRDLVDGNPRHGFLRKPVTADQLLGMLKTKLPP